MEDEILPIEHNSPLINSLIEDKSSEHVHKRLRSIHFDSDFSEIEPSEESSIDFINYTKINLLNDSDILDINNLNPNSNLKEIDIKIRNEIKNKIKEKMKKGYIPFFLWPNGYNPTFYYGRPDTKFFQILEMHIKILNNDDANDLSIREFYYDNKKIELNSTLKDLKVKTFGIINNEKTLSNIDKSQ